MLASSAGYAKGPAYGILAIARAVRVIGRERLVRARDVHVRRRGLGGCPCLRAGPGREGRKEQWSAQAQQR